MTKKKPNGTSDTPLEPSFSIQAQYLKDLSFENPQPLESFSAKEQPDMNVDMNVGKTDVGNGYFEVTLHVQAKASLKEKTMFIVEITYAALVGVQNISGDDLEQLLFVHCPTLIFPFLRAIISNTTREGGYPPLHLSPVDFASLYFEQRGKKQ